jgi:MSHA biogenesis protein MshG
VGEGSGQLEAILARLHQQLEFEQNMKEKIKSALRYPTFVLVAIAIAITILTIYVIPVFANLFRGMKMELPLATQILMGSSSFMVSYWWAVIAAGFLAYYGFRVAISTPDGRYQWDKFKLKIPIIGRIIYKATMARFAFSFALAGRSGVPLIQAFTLVSRVVDNAFYEQRIHQMREGVERGESMHRVAQSAGIFTALELQMIAVGEDTGELDDMLVQVSDMYQHEVDYEVSRLGQAIEPIMLFFMAALVLTLMLGIFLPLWDMGQMARQK